MSTGKLTYLSVKLTRLLCLLQGASFSSKALSLVAVLAAIGTLTACADAHLPVLTSIQV